MFKLKNIPMIFLAFLLLVLMAFQAWTFYLGTTDVTFKRLIGKEPYKEIKDLSLRRYKKESISPHLFTITTDDEKRVIEKIDKDCNLKKIEFKDLPSLTYKIDKEMVDVIERSPYIYLSKRYDLNRPREGRMCIIFRDKEHLYLFINGNL
jgi:hypothetical protein